MPARCSASQKTSQPAKAGPRPLRWSAWIGSRRSSSGAAKHLPNAAVSFGGFHVVQLANKAVDAVRREESRDESWLKNTRWGWLKDQTNWIAKEQDKMGWMPHGRVKTARAWPYQRSATRHLQKQPQRCCAKCVSSQEVAALGAALPVAPHQRVVQDYQSALGGNSQGV